MNTITIPKKLIKDDLVIISRKEYENLLKVSKIKKLTFNDNLDKIISDVRRGKAVGSFNSIKDLKSSLEK